MPIEYLMGNGGKTMAVVEAYDLTPLTELSVGCSAFVNDLDLPSDTVSRLEGLGICAGRDIRIVKCGEPMIVSTHGSRIGIASSLAEHINIVGNRPRA